MITSFEAIRPIFSKIALNERQKDRLAASVKRAFKFYACYFIYLSKVSNNRPPIDSQFSLARPVVEAPKSCLTTSILYGLFTGSI